MMKKLLIILTFFCIKQTKAADSLIVAINKTILQKGDTLSALATLKYTDLERATVTLNVWIENIETHQTWKYRYPLVNGEISFDLVIDENLPEGKYALNFLVQNAFFNIQGKVKNPKWVSGGLNVHMLQKNKDPFISKIKLDDNGNFKVGKIGYPDTANFIFGTIDGKTKNIFIDLETPLDSAFTPICIITQIIKVGKSNNLSEENTNLYEFDIKKFDGYFTLAGVTVNAKKKKLYEQFEEEYVSSSFRDGQVFDGLENNQIKRYGTVIEFLTFLFPAFRTADLNNVSFFLDEFRIDSDFATYISPSEIALIKLFGPNRLPPLPILYKPSFMVIAIYTKRGKYYTNKFNKNNFVVKGYTAQTYTWR